MPIFPPGQLFAYTLFQAAASITPGPNNAMLMASGANFGMRRTVPHMVGVVVGYAILLTAVGFGLGGVLAAYPPLYDILTVIGALYLLYLAWRIATATSLGGGEAARPYRFLEIVAFQWVNPKAWIGAVSSFAVYAPRDNYASGAVIIILIAALVNTPVVLIWTSFGAVLSRFLQRTGALRIFNWTMAVLLVASLIPVVLERIPA